MASDESKKYILCDIEKENLNEGCKDLAKIYKVLRNLDKPNLIKEQGFLVLNQKVENALIIKASFTTSFIHTAGSERQFSIRGEYTASVLDLESNLVLEESETPYSIAVLEYVSKYLAKLYKNDSDVIRSRVCNICLKQSQNCKKCACRTIYYCSTDCQKADWKSHKKHCKPIK